MGEPRVYLCPSGLLPIATRLGLAHGWAVCSNGALTIHLDPSGYDIVEARLFDPTPVIRRAVDVAPAVRVAIEEIGWGWRPSSPFEPGELNRHQKNVLLADLIAEPATRIALTAPDLRRYTDALRATAVTVAAQRADWLDITASGVNKAVALDAVRTHLDIRADRTVAVGDGINDLAMLAWAARSVAMGHAPAIVRSAADETTGTISQGGALAVLHDLRHTAACLWLARRVDLATVQAWCATNPPPPRTGTYISLGPVPISRAWSA